MNKHIIWAITIFSIVLMICGTILWINHNSWTIRFEMDDNTKEAIESVEYPIVDNSPVVPCSAYCWDMVHKNFGNVVFSHYEDGFNQSNLNEAIAFLNNCSEVNC